MSDATRAGAVLKTVYELLVELNEEERAAVFQNLHRVFNIPPPPPPKPADKCWSPRPPGAK